MFLWRCLLESWIFQASRTTTTVSTAATPRIPIPQVENGTRQRHLTAIRELQLLRRFSAFIYAEFSTCSEWGKSISKRKTKCNKMSGIALNFGIVLQFNVVNQELDYRYHFLYLQRLPNFNCFSFYSLCPSDLSAFPVGSYAIFVLQ